MKRMISRSIFIIIVLFLALIMLTSYKEITKININTNRMAKSTTNIKKLYSNRNNNPNTSSINIDKLKKAMTICINNDIWFNGANSTFYGFKNQKSKFDIYTDPQSPDLVTIIFERRFGHGNYSIYEGNEYYAVNFWKGYKGYDTNVPMGDIEELNITTLKNRVKELKYGFYAKGEIKFDKVTEPAYPKLTKKRAKVFNDIEKSVYDRLRDWNKHGLFKIYIRNFKDSDYGTYIVVEDSKGKSWVLDIGIDSIGYISTGKFLKVGVDEDKYTANQYKKVSVIKKTLIIK